jgi:hypothetical protein
VRSSVRAKLHDQIKVILQQGHMMMAVPSGQSHQAAMPCQRQS